MKQWSGIGFLLAVCLFAGCCQSRPNAFSNRADGAFNVRDYGAKGDGIANDTDALRAAAEACRAAGGGCVLVPAGIYRTGMVDLHSNMELHLGEGAILVSTLDVKDFTIGAGDEAGVGDACLVALIRARHAENIKITGCGTIDGRVMSFMFEDFDNGGVGEEHFAMEKWEVFRPRSVYFENVKNWSVRGVTLRDSASWTLHVRGCVDGIIENVRIFNPLRAANTDAIDIDSCRGVVVRNCTIETGDDAIVLKTKCFPDSERGGAKYGPCENILVSNVTAVASSAAFKIGTETAGDCRHIRFVDCRASGSAQAISVYSRDGGLVEDVLFERIEASAYRRLNAPGHRLGFTWWGAGNPIFLSAAYRMSSCASDDLVEPGLIRNVVIRGCHLECEASAYLVGLPGKICNVRIEDCRIDFVRRGRCPTDRLDEQPSMSQFRAVPMAAVFADHIEGLVCKNIAVSWKSDRREGWTGEFAELTDCPDALFDGIRVQPIAAEIRYNGEMPVSNMQVPSVLPDTDPERVGARILAQALSTPPERYAPCGWHPASDRRWGVGRGVCIDAAVSRLLKEALRYARTYGSEYWESRLLRQIATFSRAKRPFVPSAGEDLAAYEDLMRELSNPSECEYCADSRFYRKRFNELLAMMDNAGNVGDGYPERQAEMLRLCVLLKADE